MSKQSPIPVTIGRNVRYVLTQGIRRGEPKAAIITRCWPDDAKSAVNLTVFPDLANDEGAEKFACSAEYDPSGKEPGTWHWPQDAGDGFPVPPQPAATVLVCGVDCHQGDDNCNGYCTGNAARPPSATARGNQLSEKLWEDKPWFFETGLVGSNVPGLVETVEPSSQTLDGFSTEPQVFAEGYIPADAPNAEPESVAAAEAPQPSSDPAADAPPDDTPSPDLPSDTASAAYQSSDAGSAGDTAAADTSDSGSSSNESGSPAAE